MKVSIITVTYNSGKTIASTIESVLRQSHKDIDYWIIDGGSTDNTINIVKSYEPLADGRLHWISEKDKGIYDAMNKGIRHCSGEIVGILNSDDYYTSNDCLETIVRTFSEAEAKGERLDATYGDIHYIRDERPDRCVRYYSSAHFRPGRLRFGYMPAHPSFYVRREVYERVGLYSLNYKIASDYDMMVRLFIIEKIHARYINKDFVTMRLGGLSTSSIANRLLITREDVKACRNNGYYTNLLLISMKYLTKIFEFR